MRIAGQVVASRFWMRCLAIAQESKFLRKFEKAPGKGETPEVRSVQASNHFSHNDANKNNIRLKRNRVIL